mmetsp:Transcript_16746/g.28210  ORF Transcript_16746/g.28210 Transcript_16746/m.28210 type:complete len:348 (-) Transcript_16746:109-1152(-)
MISSYLVSTLYTLIYNLLAYLFTGHILRTYLGELTASPVPTSYNYHNPLTIQLRLQRHLQSRHLALRDPRFTFQSGNTYTHTQQEAITRDFHIMEPSDLDRPLEDIIKEKSRNSRPKTFRKTNQAKSNLNQRGDQRGISITRGGGRMGGRGRGFQLDNRRKGNVNSYRDRKYPSKRSGPRVEHDSNGNFTTRRNAYTQGQGYGRGPAPGQPFKQSPPAAVALEYAWGRAAAAGREVDVLRASLFDTEIVKVMGNGYVTLDSGGYRTLSTLLGMNTVLKPVNLKVNVVDKSTGEWSVTHFPSRVVQDFRDKMVISSFPDRDWVVTKALLERLPTSIQHQKQRQQPTFT